MGTLCKYMDNRKLSVVTVNTPNSEWFIYTDFMGRACFDFLHKILFFSMQKRESLMGKLNTGKQEPEKPLYLDTFHAVLKLA